MAVNTASPTLPSPTISFHGESLPYKLRGQEGPSKELSC